MYGVKEVGKYNVDYEGLSYDGKTPYEMIIIEEFDGNTPVKGSRKTLYFRIDGKYIVPQLNTEAKIEAWLKYKNNSKIQVHKEVVVEIC